MVPMTSIVFISLLWESQWGPTNVWLFQIMQNIFFCVQHKKETYTGLEQYEGE